MRSACPTGLTRFIAGGTFSPLFASPAPSSATSKTARSSQSATDLHQAPKDRQRRLSPNRRNRPQGAQHRMYSVAAHVRGSAGRGRLQPRLGNLVVESPILERLRDPFLSSPDLTREVVALQRLAQCKDVLGRQLPCKARAIVAASAFTRRSHIRASTAGSRSGWLARSPHRSSHHVHSIPCRAERSSVSAFCMCWTHRARSRTRRPRWRHHTVLVPRTKRASQQSVTHQPRIH